ncbi:MAG: hypothetical protein QGG40_00190 [Myxococcota bacterium]|jgi:hypothetical protein|nr:hypothetical protein [Myxococcota bacterium]
MKTSTAPLLALLALGCDRSGVDLVPTPSTDYPGVIEIGHLDVISQSDLAAGNGVFFGDLGAAEQGREGGATFTFTGTGDYVCIMVDPETVFWNKSIGSGGNKYKYPDNYDDDGDLDLFAGMSSYYNGSPGVELGDFEGVYTNSQGVQIEIEYGECSQVGARSQTDAHAGRAAPEYCAIDTEEREGVEYTVVLKTFSIPLDDGVLSFAAAAVDGPCNQIGITECTIFGESPIAGTESLESAYCNGELATYCCENPDMCGDNPPTDFCD